MAYIVCPSCEGEAYVSNPSLGAFTAGDIEEYYGEAAEEFVAEYTRRGTRDGMTCQTPGAEYHIAQYPLVEGLRATPGYRVRIAVDLPFTLDLDEDQAVLLEDNMHNAMELVLAPFFVTPPPAPYYCSQGADA